MNSLRHLILVISLVAAFTTSTRAAEPIYTAILKRRPIQKAALSPTVIAPITAMFFTFPPSPPPDLD